ncbi:aldo-keto reductase family 1 member D1-like isoform X2 [Callorhinchus milii]|uniref:aldo-keto reductase family 1 member D1-like isoform X2 n=1 Tax=Callorhinchus milii TaxID=7868 RepID=UPI001C3F6677|nr:aldo-keto reductase family 1 member D1-like isoform X2 [Callorhinchus milii]
MNLTSKNHRIPLSDGNTIPIIGLGTYSSNRTTTALECYEAVKQAIDIGYRHIDGAWIYGNEAEVGRAVREKIADGIVERKDIFYCGKPGDDNYPKDENGAIRYYRTELCATWEAMEACKDAGLVKSIGVSNFNRRQLEAILNKPGLKHKPVANQVECHPYFTQIKLKTFCESHDIVLVGYSPLGTCRDKLWVNMNLPPLLEDELLVSVGKRWNKSSAQVALHYQLQRNVVIIPKSFNPQHIQSNFQVRV